METLVCSAHGRSRCSVLWLDSIARSFLLLALLLSPATLIAATSGSVKNVSGPALVLPFVENQGQFSDPNILFAGQTRDYDVRIGQRGIDYVVRGKGDRKSWFIRESFVGATLTSAVGLESATTRVSYFQGKESARWVSNLPSFKSISMGEPLEGIRLSINLDGRAAEKVIHLDSGKLVNQVRFRLRGIEKLGISDDGRLKLEASDQIAYFSQPVAFQDKAGERLAVEVGYKITADHEYGFALGNYDPALPVVIDPGLVASTFLGGEESYSQANDTKIDSVGNVYVVGTIELPYGGVTDTKFPTIAGSYDVSYNGSDDVFVAKFSPDLETLLAVTFLGSTCWDAGQALDLGPGGDIYITGWTDNPVSCPFPTTEDAYQTSAQAYYKNTYASFVSRFDANLTQLKASTLFDLGVFTKTALVDITVDSAGNVYAVGDTDGDTVLPDGGFDTTSNGWNDGLIVKFSGSLSTLISSTYLGGTQDDIVNAVSIDTQGRLFVAGDTRVSHDPDTGVTNGTFPTTPGTYQPDPSGCQHGFVSRLDGNLTSLQASTYIGVAGYNCGASTSYGHLYASDLDLDGSGRPYVTGTIDANGLPSDNGFQVLYQRYSDLYVLRMDENLSAVEAATYLGGAWGDEDASSIAIGPQGGIFVAAPVGSHNMPTSVDAYNTVYNLGNTAYNQRDAYVAKLSPDLNRLIYGTFIGGTHWDSVYGLAIGSDESIILAGETTGDSDPANNFPTTAGAFDIVNEAYSDAFVAKLEIPENLVVAVEGPATIVPGERADFVLKYKNAMKSTAENVVIVVDLPLNLEFVVTNTGGIFNVSGRCNNQMYWLPGDLAPDATGTISFRIEVPAGTPTGDFEVLARIGATNYADSTFDVAYYLDADQKAVEAISTLSADDVSSLLITHPAIAKLLNYVEQRGYAFFGTAVYNEFTTGEKLWNLYLIEPVNGAPAILSGDHDSAQVIVMQNNAFTAFDLTGGYTWDRTQGTFTPFGSMASNSSLVDQADGYGSAITRAASFGGCQFNCIVNSIPGIAFTKINTLYSLLGYSIDCIKCAQWVESGKPAKSSPDCSNCAAGTVSKITKLIPGIGDLVYAWESVNICNKDCLKNPDKHVCTKHTYDCGGCLASWLFSPFSTGSPGCKNICNTVTGLYHPVSSRFECPGLDVCVASQCNATGFESCCVEKKRRCPPSNPSCSKSKPKPGVRASHDPNAKLAAPAGGITAGTVISYELQYENEGMGDALGVFLIDRLSEELDETTLNIHNGGTYSADTRLLVWEVGDVPPGAGGEVTFEVATKYSLLEGTEIANSAKVYFPSALEITPTNVVINVIGKVVAHDLTVSTVAGDDRVIELTGDGPGELKFELTSKPLYGVLSGTAPQVTYTADEQYQGVDRFSFKVVSGTESSLPADVVIQVAAGTDTIAPEVVSHWPAAGEIGVQIHSEPVATEPDIYAPVIWAHFSEPMDPNMTTSNFQVSDLSGSVVYKEATRTAYFMPKQALAIGKTYTVTISAVQDGSGNLLANPVTWSFTTADTASLGVAYPANLDYLEFGKQAVFSREIQVVSLLNKGTDALSIGSIAVSGSGFSMAYDTCSGTQLGAGDTCTVGVQFIPPSSGTFQGTLRIPSNDPQQLSYIGTIKGTAGEVQPDECYQQAFRLDKSFTSGTTSIASEISIDTFGDVAIGQNSMLILKAPWVVLNNGFKVQNGGMLYLQAGSVDCD